MDGTTEGDADTAMERREVETSLTAVGFTERAMRIAEEDSMVTVDSVSKPESFELRSLSTMYHTVSTFAQLKNIIELTPSVSPSFSYGAIFAQ